jgi:hypothetical protein
MQIVSRHKPDLDRQLQALLALLRSGAPIAEFPTSSDLADSSSVRRAAQEVDSSVEASDPSHRGSPAA